jgi:D-glycero-alpha-D-manno-heptose 1-phosphate guanylyltransferase
MFIVNEDPIFILAGGFGTRLKSELNGKPKSLADINGTPFLDILLQKLINQGFKNFILCLHYQSDLIIEFIKERSETYLKNASVKYVVEEKPLGTGGAIKNALTKYPHNGEIIVLNSDTFIEKDFAGIANLNRNAILATVVNDAYRFGKIAIDSDGFISGFEEKNNLHEPGLINLGVYKLTSEVFLKSECSVFSIENDIFPKLINNKEKMEIYKIEGSFIDIGIPVDYELFCNKYINGGLDL